MTRTEWLTKYYAMCSRWYRDFGESSEPDPNVTDVIVRPHATYRRGPRADQPARYPARYSRDWRIDNRRGQQKMYYRRADQARVRRIQIHQELISLIESRVQTQRRRYMN